MLLQFENTNKEDISKLFAFARQNNLQLSQIDENEDSLILPGKPLTQQQLNQLIESSRKSGIISMKAAHQQIRNSHDAD